MTVAERRAVAPLRHVPVGRNAGRDTKSAQVAFGNARPLSTGLNNCLHRFRPGRLLYWKSQCPGLVSRIRGSGRSGQRVVGAVDSIPVIPIISGIPSVFVAFVVQVESSGRRR